MSRIPPREVQVVVERAGGYCEACGGPLGHLRTALHHRHARGMGGAGNKLSFIDTAVNLMLVHGDLVLNCHNLTEYSIHQNVDRSKRLFHILPWGTDPHTVPAPVVARNLRELRA